MNLLSFKTLKLDLECAWVFVCVLMHLCLYVFVYVHLTTCVMERDVLINLGTLLFLGKLQSL